MNWLEQLLFDTNSIAHVVFLYTIVISLGIYLGKINFFGISLGGTFILFAGILAGHFGFTAPVSTLSFLQNFGLILFVYCIGLQVGPGFFESFKKGGVTLNLLACGIGALNMVVMLILYFCVCPTGDPRSLPMMVGVLCGAVTNTPGLGAATEALSQVWPKGQPIPQIAEGYACAYPLGVVGIIMATISIRYLCRIRLKDEEEEILAQQAENPHVKPHKMTLKVTNAAMDGKTLFQVRDFVGRYYVCSRALHEGHVSIPKGDTKFYVGDRLLITCAEDDAEAIKAFIGPEDVVDWETQEVPMVSRSIVVTQPKMNGKTFGELHFGSIYGVSVTRISRSGMKLFADRNLRMQLGDKILVVGPEDAVERVAALMGNSVKRLNHPNLVTIFVGILVGIIFGSMPFAIPGVPTPVTLGLAGGPLVVAILIGRFGYKFRLVTYVSTSANFMLREFGLALFLASIGIKAGEHFVPTVVAGDGLMYVWTGFLITVLPILIIGVLARVRFKLNYFTIMGLVAGSTTDPPALAFANQSSNTDAPAVGYSTVYPLIMFLRIITAQLIVLILYGVS
ncbi:MAG: putative transporter [Paraprevotella sp.]|nr:putative transporter [Paraprevotella sp.]